MDLKKLGSAGCKGSETGCEKRWILMAIAARAAAKARRRKTILGGVRRWKFKKMSRYAVLKESFGEGGELGMVGPTLPQHFERIKTEIYCSSHSSSCQHQNQSQFQRFKIKAPSHCPSLWVTVTKVKQRAVEARGCGRRANAACLKVGHTWKD